MSDAGDTKICSKCGVEKDTNQFSVSKSGGFGVRSDCKECRAFARVARERNRKPLVYFGPINQKMCNKCGIVKHLANFSKKDTGAYGFAAVCKACDYIRANGPIPDVRDGCLLVSSCKSKSARLCKSCSNTKLLASPNHKEKLLAAAALGRKKANSDPAIMALARKRSTEFKRSSKGRESYRISAAKRNERFPEQAVRLTRIGTGNLIAFQARRRENEQFEAFMARMEQEAEELIGQTAVADGLTSG